MSKLEEPDARSVVEDRLRAERDTLYSQVHSVDGLKFQVDTLRAENERLKDELLMDKPDPRYEEAVTYGIEQCNEADTLREKLAEVEAARDRWNKNYRNMADALRDIENDLRGQIGKAEARVRVLEAVCERFQGMHPDIKAALSPASEQGKEEPALCTNRDCEAFGEPSPHSEHAPAPSVAPAERSSAQYHLCQQCGQIGHPESIHPECNSPMSAACPRCGGLDGTHTLRDCQVAPAEPPKLGTCDVRFNGHHVFPHAQEGECRNWKPAHDPKPPKLGHLYVPSGVVWNLERCIRCDQPASAHDPEPRSPERGGKE